MTNLETKLEKRTTAIDAEVNEITKNLTVTTFTTLSYSGSRLLDLAAERQAVRLALQIIRRETPAMAVEKIKDLVINRMTYNNSYPDPIKEKLEKAATEHLAKIIADA